MEKHISCPKYFTPVKERTSVFETRAPPTSKLISLSILHGFPFLFSFTSHIVNDLNHLDAASPSMGNPESDFSACCQGIFIIKVPEVANPYNDFFMSMYPRPPHLSTFIFVFRSNKPTSSTHPFSNRFSVRSYKISLCSTIPERTISLRSPLSIGSYDVLQLMVFIFHVSFVSGEPEDFTPKRKELPDVDESNLLTGSGRLRPLGKGGRDVVRRCSLPSLSFPTSIAISIASIKCIAKSHPISS
mmetsp:Transcript_11351/g.14828  ORF Transcript_11351/g.14828 Transcript_11351/m.14828 type:complete len:244 (+) Transcript_11351:510-1241(+)